MAKSTSILSERDAERIYTTWIRPQALDGIAPSARPTAVLVGGQPGAGKAQAAARIRAHLASALGMAVGISGDELREYHPGWRSALSDGGALEPAVQTQVGRWVARLTADAIAARANLTLTSTMREPTVVLAVAVELRTADYEVAAVGLATARDRSRQAMLVRHDLGRQAGRTAGVVSAAVHDAAFEQLPRTLATLESKQAVQRIQVVAPGGRQLYANELANELTADRWKHPTRAAEVLVDYRERRPTTREQADSVLRWQALASGLSGDEAVSRELASQVAAWSREAMEAATSDPAVDRLVHWGQVAEAFRGLPMERFREEFAEHAKAVERLAEAVRFAEKNFTLEVDRRRFVQETRERIAERIGDGHLVGSDVGRKGEGRSRGERSR